MHDLNAGNQQNLFLGKPADDLITRNEYTLDLLPLPIFYVAILDSQISANNVSTGWCQYENFHMTQIMSLGKYIG